LDYVDVGQKEGALLTTGGERVGDRGYFISPAVFANVKHEMRISQEEIFGPVVSVIKFKDEAEALRIGNGTAYSLAAGVWSRDIGRVQRFAKRARAGTVWIICALCLRVPQRSVSTPTTIPTCGFPGAACAIPGSAANTARLRWRTL